jgi:hypothetical protein
MGQTQIIKVSLDGGLTYVEAKEGVRILCQLPGSKGPGLELKGTKQD